MKQVIQRDVIVGGEYLAGEMRRMREPSFQSTLQEIIYEISLVDADLLLAEEYMGENKLQESKVWLAIHRADWNRLLEVYPLHWVSAALIVMELRGINP